jgi:succinate dehydrogenase flavin-adding protein (antitoxin of CptAB toxin-antitoxin module)
MQLEQENNHLREEIQKVCEEMESKFQQILARIDTGMLSWIYSKSILDIKDHQIFYLAQNCNRVLLQYLMMT